MVEATASDPDSVLSFDDLVFIGGDSSKLGISASAGSVGERVYFITASETLTGTINFTASTHYEGYGSPVGWDNTPANNNFDVTGSHDFEIFDMPEVYVYSTNAGTDFGGGADYALFGGGIGPGTITDPTTYSLLYFLVSEALGS